MPKPARSETDATYSERIARAIEEEILSGARPPGSHLNEQELADQFDVSRTPVREAVRYLASTGLAEMRPRRGAVVAQVPMTRLIQMFETMSELEGLCARLAARRIDDAGRKKLKATHNGYAKLAKAGKADAYYDASVEFHFQIFAATQNEVLADIAGRLCRQLNAYRRRQLRQSRRIEGSFNEHKGILDAILAGDEDAAEKLMKEHTRMVSDNVMD
ncbi:MAG: GntR family transcriptional regulator, partial [Pseudomonadota bacterium]